MSVLGVLAIACLALIGVLAIPLTLRFRLSYPGRPGDSLELRWAFGLTHFNLTAAKRHRTRIPEPDVSQPGQDRERPRSPSAPFALLRDVRFRRRIFRFVRDLWRGVKKEDLKLYARIGLGDPADTGQLWGLLGPVSGLLAGVRNVGVTLEPVFDEPVFQLKSSGRLRVVPLQILATLVALLLSPTIWAGVRTMRANS